MTQTGFKYNGIHSSEYGLFVKSKSRPALPNLRRRDVTVPHRDGVYDFGGNTYDIRIIEVDCAFEDGSAPDFRQRVRSIAKWLSFDGNLVFDDEPDKYYLGRIYQEISLEKMHTLGVIKLVFECKPFAFGRTVTEHGVFQGYPFQTPPVGPSDHHGFLNFDNRGTVSTPCRIKITNTSQTTFTRFKFQIEKEI